MTKEIEELGEVSEWVYVFKPVKPFDLAATGARAG